MKRTRSSRATRYKILCVATLAAAAVAISGCGPLLAGSAAVVGQARITDQALAAQVTAVTTNLKIAESPEVSVAILNRLVTQQLIFALADQQRISLSQADVDAFVNQQAQLAGGRERFEAVLMQKGIPADQIPAAARATLLVAQLGSRLAPGSDGEAQDSATVAAVTKFSGEVGTRVSPRFGEWNGELLRIGPPPNDLSRPIRNVSINPLEGAQVQ